MKNSQSIENTVFALNLFKW